MNYLIAMIERILAVSVVLSVDITGMFKEITNCPSETPERCISLVNSSDLESIALSYKRVPVYALLFHLPCDNLVFCRSC